MYEQHAHAASPIMHQAPRFDLTPDPDSGDWRGRSTLSIMRHRMHSHGKRVCFCFCAACGCVCVCVVVSMHDAVLCVAWTHAPFKHVGLPELACVQWQQPL